ncbi:MAG: thioredoxin family protein [Burkholderiaceae bacterium]
MYRRSLLLWAASAGAVGAAPLPYDEAADARAAIRAALGAVGAGPRRVLIVFGANWCEDCRSLDQALKSGRNAELMAREFELVKVDVGRFDRNLDVAKAYGDPIRKGIPAAVVLSADERVLYTTKAGELSNARRMSATGVYDFFNGVARSSRSAR